MAPTLRCDGTTVIPIFVNAPGYREWELTLDGQDFCIVQEDGDDGSWTLRHWLEDASSPCWQEVAHDREVETFLRTHALRLGN